MERMSDKSVIAEYEETRKILERLELSCRTAGEANRSLKGLISNLEKLTEENNKLKKIIENETRKH